MNNVFTIPTTDYSNPLADVITDYQCHEQYEIDKWSEAVSLTRIDDETVMSADQWKEYYLEAESENVVARELNGEVVKRTKKTGAIVASAAFPKTWNTDKAIISKALDTGIDLFDEDGKPKPKSALQKEYKDTPKDSDKSAMEKILTTISTYGALYAQLDSDEQELARTAMAVIHTS